MYMSVRPYTAGLAAASAGILTLGLVTAPPNTDVTVARAEAHVVQLTAVTAADIRTAIVNTTASVLRSAGTPSPAATATLQGNDSAAGATAQADAEAAPSPEQVLTAVRAVGAVAFEIAFAVIWYAGFPITLPYSIYEVFSANSEGGCSFYPFCGFTPKNFPLIFGLFGLLSFVGNPLTRIDWAVSDLVSALSALFPPADSPAAAVGSTSSSTANLSVSPQLTEDATEDDGAPVTEQEAETEVKAQVAEADGESEAGAEVGTEAEAEAEPEAGTEAEPEAGTEAEAEAEAETEAEAAGRPRRHVGGQPGDAVGHRPRPAGMGRVPQAEDRNQLQPVQRRGAVAAVPGGDRAAKAEAKAGSRTRSESSSDRGSSDSSSDGD